MASRKVGKKTKGNTAKRRDKPNMRAHGVSPELMRFDKNGDGVFPDLQFGERAITHPIRLNPETVEERKKRLAARKALTLRAFRTTYENRHRKTS